MEYISEVFGVIKGTPIWVWAIFSCLVYIGINATKDRIVRLPKLFIAPLVLMFWQYKSLTSSEILVSLVVLIFSSAWSFWLHRNSKVEPVTELASIIIPGSYSTLIVLISFFAVKYCFGYISFIAPETAVKYSYVALTVSGVFAGYIIGRASRFLCKYTKSKKQ